jgi:hypothetical protein
MPKPEPVINDEEEILLNLLSHKIHAANVEAGWWEDLKTVKSYLPVELHAMVELWFIGSKMTLVHSEVSEMFEGFRKNLMDDHITYMPMAEVEGADIYLRLADIFGFKGFMMGSAVAEKSSYNKSRADHQPENRNSDPGNKSI